MVGRICRVVEEGLRQRRELVVDERETVLRSNENNLIRWWWRHSAEVTFVLLTQLFWVRFSAFPKNFLTEISIDVDEFHR